ncbi:peptidase inhibitor family I36 protein [Micromonospora sp. ALFpr18c]|uniref:peptidase inhibitor family I36 protein n=1 Tax=unclassified Micromonospora TaxID=2617518 RepID=UPI001788CCED|nr:peptidase inhibitor family I36 protein [Micromonospora sp. ALFpr18c]
MRIAKRVGATLTAFGVALGGLTLTTTTSAQAASANDCRSGEVCLFETANFGGGIFRVSGCDKDLGDNRFSNGNPVVDHTSSIINNSGNPVFVYEYPDPFRKSGYEFGVRAGARFSSLTNVQVLDYRTSKIVNVNFDNNASAVC